MSQLNSLDNPFTVGAMVRKEENFVGRKVEIDNILARLQTVNSVSITGDRRIGKSSLLFHLYLTGNRKMGHSSDFRFVYLSFHDPEMKTQAGFAQYVLDGLGYEYDAAGLQENPLVGLSKALRDIQAAGQFVPILLMDEFERLTESKELFNDDFFEALRAFGNDGRVAYVTASMHTLMELTQAGKLTSPFWNIFSRMQLTEYQEHEPDEFLMHFWGEERLDASIEEWKWLFTIKSTHPLAMQAFSYWLYRNRKLEYGWDRLTQEVEQELGSYFRNEQEQFSKWFKERRKQLGKSTQASTEYIGDNIRNLSPLTGLISS